MVESQASSSLGVTGGYASARVDNFRRHEILSFAHAHTQASGILSEKSQAFETHVSGELEGYNLLDMVKVDYMAGRLHSKHPVEPPTDKVQTSRLSLPWGATTERLSWRVSS